MKAIAHIALRGLMIAMTVVALATLGVVVGARLPAAPAGSFAQSFERLGLHLVIGGALGLMLGIALAVRVGRRAFSRGDRAVQTLAALGTIAAIVLGAAMEE